MAILREYEVKHYTGLESEMPNKLPQGDFYFTEDTKTLYKYGEDNTPTAVGNGLVTSSDIQALTSTSNSVAWTGEEGSVYSLTLTEDTTIESPTTLVQGKTYQIIITQDGVGLHSLSYGSAFKFEGGTIPSVEIAANSITVLTCICDGAFLLVKSFTSNLL